MSAFCVLHLSDLHVGGKDEDPMYERVRERLLEDVRELCIANGIGLDAVVVTGDSVDKSGSPDAYAKVSEYFRRILESHQLDRDRLLVVPGNHDVPRRDWDALLLRELNAKKPADRQKHLQLWSVLRSRFEAFDDFTKNLMDFKSRRQGDFGSAIHDIDTGHGVIRFYLLNSAWATIDNADYGNVWISRWQLESLQALQRQAASRADLSLGLVHHPLDWFTPTERALISDFLRDENKLKVDALLHGHIHTGDINLSADPDTSLLSLVTGVGYPEIAEEHRGLPKASRCRYALYMFSPDTGQMNAWLRVSRESGDFVPDVTLYRQCGNGQFSLQYSGRNRHEVQEIASAPRSAAGGSYVLVLTGNLKEGDRARAEALVRHLQQFLGDPSLTLQRIESGSVRLVLKGQLDGLVSLVRTGHLTEVMGLPIQDVRLDVPGEGDEARLPGGVVLQARLKGHTTAVSDLLWSSNGDKLASSTSDGSVRLWDMGSLESVDVTGVEASELFLPWDRTFLADESAESAVKKSHLYALQGAGGRFVRRSPDGSKTAVEPSEHDVLVLDRSSGQILASFHCPDTITALCWSPQGDKLACASDGGTLRIWRLSDSTTTAQLSGHSAVVTSLAWSPDGSIIASASHDRTVRLWDVRLGSQMTVLEGHLGAVLSVSFSADGTLLASSSTDATTRLWGVRLGEPLAAFVVTNSMVNPCQSVAFHPRHPLLAAVDGADVLLFRLDLPALLGQKANGSLVHYSNAKVILVGESGVGKSGLGLTMSGHPFTPTASTHGRRVWSLSSTELVTPSMTEQREIFLWDLAGQPGYRLIHQLHLSDVAVALVVFDPTNETGPFAGVYHWAHALKLAHRDSSIPLKMFLVAARIDRGGVSVSKDRVEAVVNELGFDGYFETSAKEGWNIRALSEAIHSSINWDMLPRVSSTGLFQDVRAFLIREKQEGRLLSPSSELYGHYVKLGGPSPRASREQFETTLALVESRGLIRRLSFGGLVLLQPEILDAYASAMINVARDQPDGLGVLAEEDAVAGRFKMPSDERVAASETERLLLIATVEDLLRHEIAFREDLTTGSSLVFPSQFAREAPEDVGSVGARVVFSFAGPVLSVYSRLVVRLAHSHVFRVKNLWKNAAVFLANDGGECGLVLRPKGEGAASLTVFCTDQTRQDTEAYFETYVESYLRRATLTESLTRRPIFICLSCHTPVSEQQATRRMERGYDWAICPVCDSRVWLSPANSAPPNLTGILRAMDQEADGQRDHGTSTVILQGKAAVGQFDVFCAYNREDRHLVKEIARELKRRGLNPWLDVEQIAPGQVMVEEIVKSLAHSKAIAFFVGPSGLGKSQLANLQAVISMTADTGLPIIPVLLPGVTEIPSEAPMLKALTWVKFPSTSDTQALDALEWGITGIRWG